MTAETILSTFPVAGDGVVMGISTAMGDTLVSAGLAVRRRRDRAVVLNRSGRKRLAKLSGAASGTIRTVAPGSTLHLTGGKPVRIIHG
jgi:hypothetical protein